MAGCFQASAGGQGPSGHSERLLLYPWLSNARTELRLLPAKHFLVILHSKAPLPVTCASLTPRGWHRGPCARSAERPLRGTGVWGHCSRQALCNAQLTVCAQCRKAQAHPTLRDFPFIAKITTVLSAKQLHRASVFYI